MVTLEEMKSGQIPHTEYMYIYPETNTIFQWTLDGIWEEKKLIQIVQWNLTWANIKIELLQSRLRKVLKRAGFKKQTRNWVSELLVLRYQIPRCQVFIVQWGWNTTWKRKYTFGSCWQSDKITKEVSFHSEWVKGFWDTWVFRCLHGNLSGQFNICRNIETGVRILWSRWRGVKGWGEIQRTSDRLLGFPWNLWSWVHVRKTITYTITLSFASSFSSSSFFSFSRHVQPKFGLE